MGAIPTYGSIKIELQKAKEQLREKDRQITNLTRTWSEKCEVRQKLAFRNHEQKQVLFQKQEQLENKLQLQYARLTSSILQLTVPHPVPKHFWGHATRSLDCPSSVSRKVPVPQLSSLSDKQTSKGRQNLTVASQQLPQSQTAPSTTQHPEKEKKSNNSGKANITRLLRIISSLEIKYGGAPPPNSRPEQSVVPSEFIDLWNNCLSLDRFTAPLLVSPPIVSKKPKYSTKPEWTPPPPQPYLLESILKPKRPRSTRKNPVVYEYLYPRLPAPVCSQHHQEAEDHFREGDRCYEGDEHYEGVVYQDEDDRPRKDCHQHEDYHQHEEQEYLFISASGGGGFSEDGDLIQFSDGDLDENLDYRSDQGEMYDSDEAHVYDGEQDLSNADLGEMVTTDDAAQDNDYGRPEDLAYPYEEESSSGMGQQDYDYGQPEEGADVDSDLNETEYEGNPYSDSDQMEEGNASFSASAEQHEEDSQTEASFSDTSASFSDDDYSEEDNDYSDY